jgi:hypothetical protein
MSSGHLRRALEDAGRVRQLSKQAFDRTSLIEVCVAIADMDETFAFGDLYERLESAADQVGVVPPDESSVRNDLKRLRDTFRALERQPVSRGDRVKREKRLKSPIWALAHDLVDRTG